MNLLTRPNQSPCCIISVRHITASSPSPENWGVPALAKNNVQYCCFSKDWSTDTVTPRPRFVTVWLKKDLFTQHPAALQPWQATKPLFTIRQTAPTHHWLAACLKNVPGGTELLQLQNAAGGFSTHAARPAVTPGKWQRLSAHSCTQVLGSGQSVPWIQAWTRPQNCTCLRSYDESLSKTRTDSGRETDPARAARRPHARCGSTGPAAPSPGPGCFTSQGRSSGAPGHRHHSAGQKGGGGQAGSLSSLTLLQGLQRRPVVHQILLLSVARVRRHLAATAARAGQRAVTWGARCAPPLRPAPPRLGHAGSFPSAKRSFFPHRARRSLTAVRGAVWV